MTLNVYVALGYSQVWSENADTDTGPSSDMLGVDDSPVI